MNNFNNEEDIGLITWIRDFWEYTIKRKIEDVYYFIKHVIKGSHNIKTNLPIGRWYDVDTKIEAGMLSLIENLVSKDKQDLFNHWVCETDEDFDCKNTIIDYLYFKYIEENEIEKQINEYCNIMWSERGRPSEIGIENWLKTINDEKSEQYKNSSKNMFELEMYKYNKETKLLQKLIKYRNYFWT